MSERATAQLEIDYLRDELASLKNSTQKIMDTLKAKGYYTSNMWHIEDIREKYQCDRGEAYGILDVVMCDMTEQIFEAIDIEARKHKLKLV
jgi:uncharacterized protein (UPF0335 family)